MCQCVFLEDTYLSLPHPGHSFEMLLIAQDLFCGIPIFGMAYCYLSEVAAILSRMARPILTEWEYLLASSGPLSNLTSFIA